MKKILGSI